MKLKNMSKLHPQRLVSSALNDNDMEIQSLQPEVQPFIFKKYDNQGKSYDDMEDHSQIPSFDITQQPPYHNHMKRKVMGCMMPPLVCIFDKEGDIGVEGIGREI